MLYLKKRHQNIVESTYAFDRLGKEGMALVLWHKPDPSAARG
jgi:hypothetical protein